MFRILRSSVFASKSCARHLRRLYRHLNVRYISKISKADDIRKIRNIGIIAHIDAGKTTTTERMLYYSGFTDMMGEVHDGDTIMDYMIQERERGITITSAAITFNWKKHKINLIDTPGHVDFTFEVERSLSVLDGAIVILDASAGVEVQTLKVWEQANRYSVPCIFYLNKLDKPAADIELSLKSIKDKLKVQPLMLHSPLGEGKEFSGIVDLITLNKYLWDKNLSKDGRHFVTEQFDIEKEEKLGISVLNQRDILLEHIADLDDVIGDKYLSSGMDSLSAADLQAALRRITFNKSAVPVLCGSSYRNVGVQLLMDAVLNYLPDPSERKHDFVESNSEELCALVFKISHSKNKDPLTFLRIYSGTLKSGQRVHIKNREISGKMGKLMVPLADDLHEVSSLSTGNIAVALGLKETVTGDLLFSTASAAAKAECFRNKSVPSMGPLIQVPDPVFFCTIEPPSVGLQKQLDFALQCLQREDPTFQVETDEAVGQTILMGMGELHIDIIKERIRAEYGIDAYLGPLQVAYRESLGKSIEYTHVLDKTFAGSRHFAKLTMNIYPCSLERHQSSVKVIVTKENDLGKIRPDHLKAIHSGIKNALNNGPLLNFPVINVGMDLLWLEVKKGTSMSMLSAAASQCVTAALRQSTMYLLEPVMNLSIVMKKGFAGRVINDLTQKRSQILNMEMRQDVEIIQSRTPLSELKGYSTVLRALTAGTCSFTIEFESYQRMESNEQAKAVEDVTGFSSF